MDFFHLRISYIFAFTCKIIYFMLFKKSIKITTTETELLKFASIAVFVFAVAGRFNF